MGAAENGSTGTRTEPVRMAGVAVRTGGRKAGVSPGVPVTGVPVPDLPGSGIRVSEQRVLRTGFPGRRSGNRGAGASSRSRKAVCICHKASCNFSVTELFRNFVKIVYFTGNGGAFWPNFMHSTERSAERKRGAPASAPYFIRFQPENGPRRGCPPQKNEGLPSKNTSSESTASERFKFRTCNFGREVIG